MTVIPSPNSTKNEVLLRVYESALIFRRDKGLQFTSHQLLGQHVEINTMYQLHLHDRFPNLKVFYDNVNEFAEIVLGPSDPPLPWSVISGYHEEESEASHAHPCHKPFTGDA